jgi:thiol-disulfide isomerase/thioredoxin
MGSLTNVYYLEDSDFDGNKLVGFKKMGMENKPVLCFVFASWCGHCKIAKPEFQKFANMIKDMGEPIYVCAIQADGKSEGEQMLAKKVREQKIIPGFQGFPHILKYVDGNPAGNYEGPRKADDLLKFMQ